MARRKPTADGGEMNMTPMIDVVFQLIIFFVVTLKMSKQINEDIQLEDSIHGETITQDSMPVQTIVIEVSRRSKIFPRAKISINNATLSDARLHQIIAQRYKKFGAVPVLIRADWRAKHEDVKRVMDICTGVGCWKIGFVAVQEHHETESHHKNKKKRK